MKIFLIVFALAILFVVGSAAMMNYFTGRTTPAKQDKKTSKTDSPRNPDLIRNVDALRLSTLQYFIGLVW